MTIHPNYPTPDEVDAWCDSILDRAEKVNSEPERIEEDALTRTFSLRQPGNTLRDCFFSFPSAGGGAFYCYWEPAPQGPAPLLFHLPGGLGNMSVHPSLACQGFHVLHINPLGYTTPDGCSRGEDEPTVMEEPRAVFNDTLQSGGEKGFVDWFTDAAVAVRWALARPDVQSDRYGIFGTSQGGMGALVMGSILSSKGCRAIGADLPGCVNFPAMRECAMRGDLTGGEPTLVKLVEGDEASAIRAIGFIDAMSHVHRLTMPVLLTGGEKDTSCPADLIQGLFLQLPGTRSLTLLAGHPHFDHPSFNQLAAAWFRSYV